MRSRSRTDLRVAGGALRLASPRARHAAAAAPSPACGAPISGRPQSHAASSRHADRRRVAAFNSARRHGAATAPRRRPHPHRHPAPPTHLRGVEVRQAGRGEALGDGHLERLLLDLVAQDPAAPQGGRHRGRSDGSCRAHRGWEPARACEACISAHAAQAAGPRSRPVQRPSLLQPQEQDVSKGGPHLWYR